jgi:hypothetical protein
MAKKPSARLPVAIEPEAQPTYEPMDTDQADSSDVVVDVELARTPHSDTAKSIAAEIKGSELIDQIEKSLDKARRAGLGSVLLEINPYDLWLEAGWNVRNFDTPQRKAKIAEYATSIGKIGVTEALSAHVKDSKIVVHAGWHRLLATYRAIEHGFPVKAIPVRFGQAIENDADRTLSQLVSNGGSDLTPFEKGRVIKRMINFRWPLQEIADAIGKSVTNVKGLLDLQALPMSLQDLVASGTVSAYYATKAYREADDNEEKALHELQSAIATAKAQGATRVMPKHGEDAPPRRARGSGGGGGGGGRGRRRVIETSPSDAIPRLVALIRLGRAEKDEEANTVLISYPLDVYNEIAVLAELPDDFEIGLEPDPVVAEDVDAD